MMKHATAITVALGALLLAGCGTIGSKSPSPEQLAMEAQYQALVRQLDAAATVKATDAGDNHIAEVGSVVPQSGAFGWARHRKPVILDGKLQFDQAGKVVYDEQEAIGKSNSMREISSVDAVAFTLAGVPVDPSTGELYTDKLVGLFLTLKQGAANTGLDSDFAAVWAGKTTAEKQAGAAAAAEYLKTKIGGIVAAITATGDQVTGILKEVQSATPVGAGLAAVKTVIERDGKAEAATVVEPLRE